MFSSFFYDIIVKMTKEVKMIQIGESSYYFDPSSREVYRKVKMTKQGYHIKDKHGKLKWITLATIEKCLVKMTNSSSSSSQND